MAPPAGETATAFGADLTALLAPFPGRLEHAVRMAAVCTVVLVAVQLYGTPEPALTVYVAFFMVKADRFTSIVTGALFLALVSTVLGLLLFIATRVADAPFARLVAMATLSFGFLFLAVASQLKGIASIVALITGYALDLLGTAHTGEVVTRVLLYAWLFVAFPAAACVAVNLAFGPSPRRRMERALAHRLEQCAHMLRGPSPRTRRAFARDLRAGLGEVAAWSNLVAKEKTSPPADVAALAWAVKATAAIESSVDRLDREGGLSLSVARRAHLADTLDEMAIPLQQGRYPVDIDPGDLDEEAPTSPRAAAAQAELLQALRTFAEPPLVGAIDAPAETKTEPSTSGLFLPDAVTNPAHVRYALKTTAAAMICYVTYSILDWPGIHTCLVTCYVVSLGTTAETVEKLTLRIVGALVGGGAGVAAMVFVLPALTTVGGLALVVFAGTLVGAWVAVGSARISYMGVQIGYAFLLCVVQGTAPAFDLTLARDRILGILLGNVVIALVSISFWPESIALRIESGLARLAPRLATERSVGDPAARWSDLLETRTALAAIADDLDRARYEPRSIRPSESWMAARRQRLRELTGSLDALSVTIESEGRHALE